jgi:hypothetical protein
VEEVVKLMKKVHPEEHHNKEVLQGKAAPAAVKVKRLDMEDQSKRGLIVKAEAQIYTQAQ